MVAQLQGASLNSAQLQSAWLPDAQLQGASLDAAALHGATLVHAKLQGASLGGTELKGADLSFAERQGASLEHAFIGATDLSYALLWRTNGPQAQDFLTELWLSGTRAKPTEVRLPEDPSTWLPVFRAAEQSPGEEEWTEETYKGLQQLMDSIPPGPSRDMANERIQRLDCAGHDLKLASCDFSANPPFEATAWRKSLEGARVDDQTYGKALAAQMKRLACSDGDADANILRSAAFDLRLEDAGPPAIDLIHNLMNKDIKDCAVSSALTDADRARLLRIKQSIEAAKKEGG